METRASACDVPPEESFVAEEPPARYAASLADHYAEWIGRGVREAALLQTPREWTELELQARWYAGDFGRDFRATTGEAVRIVQFGVWNREAGPDFAEAAVSIDGGEAVRGAIEFDMDMRDWERHGHGENPHYNGVILHVCTRTGASDFFTRTANHRRVPQVVVNPAALEGESGEGVPEALPGRCVGPLRALPESKVREVLLAAALFRLRRKSGALSRMAETHGMDEALYQALAAALGYKSNKLPFTLLAQRLPLKLLLKHREEAPALLFGVSGFLPWEDLRAFDFSTREYIRALWEKWWARRAEFSRLTVGPDLWRMSGQRPANHPQRRLAALAQIVQHWHRFRAVRSPMQWRAFGELLAELSDPYWDFHYTVESKPSKRRMALVGDSRIVEIAVNVLMPLAMAQGESVLPAFESLRAPLANRRVEIAALRLFADNPLGRELLKSAAMQQGLLQVYEDYCMQDASDCAGCRFPQQLAAW